MVASQSPLRHQPALSLSFVFPSPPSRKRRRVSLSQTPSHTSTTGPDCTSSNSLHHFSAIRTTSTNQAAPLDCASRMIQTPMNSMADICLCVDGEIPPPTCKECAQECKDGACAIALSAQCTDQCVVVPCNDAHHAGKSCDHTADSQPCDSVACPSGPDCTVLDEIVGILCPSLTIKSD